MHGYIRDNFHPDDRLAVICKRDRVQQLIVTAAELLNLYGWLRIENQKGANIYVSMNALLPEAKTRTKRDIAAIRHIYLDIDRNGRDALALIQRDAPRPSYIVKTSPDKYQIVWKVAGFNAKEAEVLQKAMAVRYGADRAATDVSRVLRLPGFENRKYDTPYMVTAEKVSDQIYNPSDFHIDRLHDVPAVVERNPVNHEPRISGSQSERDWFETCRRIECGDNPNDIQIWLEQLRQDKPNPKYYAELTVTRALTHCAAKTKPSSEQESIMEKTKENTQEYIIGHVPAGMGKQLGKDGLRLQWDEEIGWHTTDPEKAKAAHAKILEQHPRYYFEGNTYAVKDKIAALNKDADSPEKRIYFDPYTRKQYAITANVHAAVQAQIPQKREKLYLEGDGKAIYAINAQLKEMRTTRPDGKEIKALFFDIDNKKWYAYDPEALKKAQAALAAEMKNPRYQQAAKDHNNTSEKHYIPDVPFELNKKIKEIGGKWDPDAKCFYHTDPEKAKEANRLVAEARELKHGVPSVAQAVVEKVTHEM